jgi:hypothetical protein
MRVRYRIGTLKFVVFEVHRLANYVSEGEQNLPDRVNVVYHMTDVTLCKLKNIL